MVNISGSGPQLEEKDLHALEARLRICLPDDYSKFLLAYNGGKPEPATVNIQGWEKNPSHRIQVFFRIGGRTMSSELVWNYEVTRGRIPKELLPIASTGTGDLFCISLSGSNKNYVYIWDSQDERTEPTYENIYTVARSFKEFLDGFYHYDPLESKNGPTL